MASRMSRWGETWGSRWGGRWGAVTALFVPSPGKGGGRARTIVGISGKRTADLVAALRKTQAILIGDAPEPLVEIAEEIKETVAKAAPVNVPITQQVRDIIASEVYEEVLKRQAATLEQRIERVELPSDLEEDFEAIDEQIARDEEEMDLMLALVLTGVI